MAEQKKKEYDAISVFDTIVDATAKYLRAIFPPLFFLSKKNTSTEDREKQSQHQRSADVTG